MSQQKSGSERLEAFSDGVFAVVITVLVLDLRPPEAATLGGLLRLWPVGLSYAVSYLFIAIVWVNHHHLLRYAEKPTLRLVWGNFAHLFSVSLMPFSTAWIASTRMAPVPVAVYATVLLLVNATYLGLCREAVDRDESEVVPMRARHMMRMRSTMTMAVFGVAAIVSLKYPMAGVALICCCLFVYVQPGVPGTA
ncbi:Putative integral membrane protein [Paraburkholderia caribensis MBA4]|uniref:Integral membrane protein n=1 Tax=Paraburkholderia caribensis MBA4 TaxID=1323664 RepID=A0A0P0RI79_9BURK|nr:TMEM175 family protein [Paraburkholderia caribensis]ALL68304.1 Putative integral membrane protein [Paraburkholderia caribensis MBA4]